MSIEPRRICRECQQLALVGERYCGTHQRDNRALRAAREREIERRATGLKPLYDSAAWRNRTRPYVLRRDLLCKIAVVCDGRSPSVDVDHIIRAELYIAQHDGDHRFFYDTANLRGACHACHSHKTALEERGQWNEADCGGQWDRRGGDRGV